MAAKSQTQSLTEQVRSLEARPGHLAIWALGQSGFLLKGGSHVVIIDPYLSDYVEEIAPDPPGAFARMVLTVARPEELGMVTVVLSTHHHADHCDPHTLVPLMEAAPRARLLASYTARDVLLEAGVHTPRIELPPVGEALEFGGGLTITAIPSAHYGFDLDESGNPAYLGYIISLGGVTLYHSGDTIVYDGLIERLKEHQLDIVCLPINGRDWFREQQGITGNMDYREAAELAARVGARVFLPMHNDMFAGNRVNPAYLVDYLASHNPRQRFHFLQAGELYYYLP